MSAPRVASIASFVLACVATAPFAARTAAAHDGPPFPIVVDRKTEHGVLSVWADPDVGIGTYWLYLEPYEGHELAPDTTAEIFVSPADGHQKEAGYPTERSKRTGNDQQRFLCEVQFDELGVWHTRVVLHGARGDATVEQDVDVTPPGAGPVFDFILYLFPFVAVGLLFIKAAIRRRNMPAPRPASPPVPPTDKESA